jgi:deoxynucleoside triphosphate triphosphohydrolase SAMHD1
MMFKHLIDTHPEIAEHITDDDVK